MPGRATEEPAAGCDFGTASTDNVADYPNGQTFEWVIELDPALAIGLDFDLERVGTLLTSIQSSVASPEATLRMQLLYCASDQQPQEGDPDFTFSRCSGRYLLLGNASASRALSANSAAAFELEFTPTADADFLPFTRDSNLVLHLALTSTQPLTPPSQSGQEYGPLLVVKGSKITLPLIEYHDPIDQAFQNVGTLELDADGPFEKSANPGRRSLFPFDLTNRGQTEQRVSIQIEGHNRDWARLVGDTTRTLAPGQTTNFTIVTEVPVDAAAGERAELFVVGQSESDPNVVAISRLRATVVDPTVQDIPDEDPSSLDEGAPGTPGPGIALVALAVLFTTWTRRRR